MADFEAVQQTSPDTSTGKFEVFQPPAISGLSMDEINSIVDTRRAANQTLRQIDAFVRSTAEGATMGASSQIAAGLDATFDQIGEFFTGDDNIPFSQEVDRNIQEQRIISETDREDFTSTTVAGSATGFMAGPGKFFKAGKGVIPGIVRIPTIGAGLGAMGAAIEDTNVATGAAIGAATGLAGSLAGGTANLSAGVLNVITKLDKFGIAEKLANKYGVGFLEKAITGIASGTAKGIEGTTKGASKIAPGVFDSILNASETMTSRDRKIVRDAFTPFLEQREMQAPPGRLPESATISTANQE